MKDKAFWSVELGVGMGPLVLGRPRNEILEILQKHLRNEVDSKELDDIFELDDNEIYIDAIETNLVFSSDSPPSLKRLDVAEDRVTFGSMEVLGKPLHEIVALLNIPASETLWCDFYDDDEQVQAANKKSAPKSDHLLLVAGTLWITSLGLGLTVYRGKVDSIHLCTPDDSPRYGTGTWNDQQKELSEAGFESTSTLKNATKAAAPEHILIRLMFLAMVIAIGSVIWKGVRIQQEWDREPDVQATVVAKDPPPPAPFPDTYTVSYSDGKGVARQATFRAVDVYGVPEVGAEIPIRFLPSAPDKPLTHVHLEDVGFDYAIPRCIAIGAIYLVLRLLAALLLHLLEKRKSTQSQQEKIAIAMEE